jgi:hypothetical protein
MMTPEEESYALARAYVPEHIVSLMTLISKGSPFLIEDHLVFVRDNWLILVGYPLDGNFSQVRCERVLKLTSESFRFEILWFIGPEAPTSCLDSCKERQSDLYYALDLEKIRLRPSLLKMVEKASENLIIEKRRSLSKEHQALTSELLARETLPPRVRELYLAMPEYVGRSASAWTIDARDLKGRLCAFSVIDMGAENFSAYILGAHSKKIDAPHASDRLFLEMIHMTREQGKTTMNLGLGVNEGIRRFKKKWGGKPFLNYEFCEFRLGKAKKVSLIDALMGHTATRKVW